MEASILLAGMDKLEFKKLLQETLLEILNRDNERRNVSGVFDAKEAADFLKVKVTTVYEKTSSKSIPHFKKGNKLYFHRCELEQWMKEGKVKTIDELRHEALNFTQRKPIV